MEDLNKIGKVLDEHWKELREFPNVLSINVGKKVKDGIDTGKACITVYVSKKVDKKYLAAKDILPKSLQKIPVDVIELSTNDWEIGDTEVSHKSPSEIKTISSGVKKNGKW